MRARKTNQMPCHSSAILSSADTIIATTTTTTDMEKKPAGRFCMAQTRVVNLSC